MYILTSTLLKTLHQAINVTMTEVKLFTIRCRISQAIQISNISCIIIITDSMYVAQRIFDSNIHLYKLQLITISKDLRLYFNKHSDNSIKSNKKWPLYMLVDKDTKEFNLTFLYPCKTSWDFSKKKECDNIIRNWQMFFQMSNFKEKQFLDLLDDDFNTIEPLCIKGGLWIKHFGYSNLLCTRAMRAIANHTLIEEYYL